MRIPWGLICAGIAGLLMVVFLQPQRGNGLGVEALWLAIGIVIVAFIMGSGFQDDRKPPAP
jgi:hypothetical protein